jgi:hypothetical protein
MISLGHMLVDGCTFDANQALANGDFVSGVGGAMHLQTRYGDRPFRGAPSDLGTSPQFEAHASYDIRNSVFTNNAAQPMTGNQAAGITAGGAIAASHGGLSLAITNCSFSQNAASRGGALWYAGQSSVSIFFLHSLGFTGPGGSPLDYEDVFATSDYVDYFSASSNNDYTSLAPHTNVSGYRVVVTGSSFDSNVAAPALQSGRAMGGAVYVACGKLQVASSRFADNSAQPSALLDLGSSGGAVFVTNDCPTSDFAQYVTTNVTLTDSSFDGHTAASRGGAVAVEHAPSAPQNAERTMLLSVRNCSFSNSSTQLLGGALFAGDNSEARLQDVVLAGGAASLGGGVYAAGDAQVTLLGVACERNAASAGGCLYASGLASVLSAGCSYAGNAAVNGSALAVSDDALLSSSFDEFATNVASIFGSIIYHASAVLLSLQNATLLPGNSAAVGAIFLANSSQSSASPALAAGAAAAVSNYGAGVATLPSSFQAFVSAAGNAALPSANASWPPLATRSGRDLGLSVVLFDDLGSPASYWTDFTLDLSCTAAMAPGGGGTPAPCPAGSLRGNTHATCRGRRCAAHSLTLGRCGHVVHAVAGAGFAVAADAVACRVARAGHHHRGVRRSN